MAIISHKRQCLERLNSEDQFFNDFYSRRPKAYENLPALERQAELYTSKINKSFQFKKTETVLSLGCAQGRFELRFAPKVKKIIGMDVSEKGILLAKKKAKKLGIKNADFYVYDITQKLPFKDQSFDGVLALGIFHHINIQKLNPLLTEINRVLKTNGFLYAIDPNAGGILRIIGRTFFKKTYQSYHSPEEHDINNEELTKMCLEAGFKVEKKEFLDFCLAESAFLWPNLPPIFFDFLFIFDKIWCNTPLIKHLSSQFSLFCRKRR